MFYFLLLIVQFFGVTYAQESDSIQYIRKMVFLGPRCIPYDTIPYDAYTSMFQQKMDLRNSQGYSLSNIAWSCLGPKPIYEYGTSAGRISCVAFDPRVGSGNTIWIGGLTVVSGKQLMEV